MVLGEIRGPENGEPVLMLHGFTDSSFSFSRVLPLLPASMRAVVPDQRGHGDSDRPDERGGGYDVEDLATDAIQLLDAFSIGRATVVGHSMGSFVARRVAARVPERVSRLVLVGAGPTPRNEALVLLKTEVDRLADPVDPAFIREFQMSTVNREVPPEFMESVIAESRKLPARIWKAALAGMMNYEAAESGIRCRTLILGGDRDSVFSRAEQEDLARRIPGATVTILSGIGHTPHWEDPERVVAELRAFVE